VVEASNQLVNVFVDCDWGNKNTDLSARYGVQGYPTVIFTDPTGKVIAPLGDRSPDGVLRQIQGIAKKSGGGLLDSWEKAAEAARKEKKPVLFLFVASGRDSAALEEALFDDALEQARAAFVIAKAPIRRDNADAKRFGVASLEQPVILVLDPRAEKPEAAPLKRIVGKRSAKELLKELQSIPRPKGV
jgi:hypothetical protein